MTSNRRSAKPRKKTPADTSRDLLKPGGARAPGARIGNTLKQPQNRWQRAVRYTWDKNRGRG